MTDDLIKELRSYECLGAPDWYARLADALEAKDEEIQNLENRLRVALDAVKEDAARIAALEAALKPFAYDYGDYTDGMWSDLDYIQVTVGDLRAARAAMEGKDG